MAKKQNFSVYKTMIKNYCHDCGEQAEIVKVARTKHARLVGIPTGFMWRCKKNDEHMNRTRRYEVIQVKVR